MSRWTLVRDAFTALLRSVRRRPPGPGEFTYHRRSQLVAFLVLFVFTLPVEILLIELLVPWDVMRWVLLALAVVGSLWAIGVILSVRVFSHRMLDRALEVRYGALGGTVVPYDRILAVELSRGTAPRGEGVSVDAPSETAWLAAGGLTALMIQLSDPITISDGWAHRGPIRTLHVAADDPERMLAALEERLARISRSAS